MPPDDVGEFLKFLDNVSVQLACLLDIDGKRDLKKIYGKQSRILSNSSRGKIASKSNCITSQQSQSNKKQQQKAATTKQSTRAKGRRKLKQQGVEAIYADADTKEQIIPESDISSIHRQQQTQQQQQLQHHQHQQQQSQLEQACHDMQTSIKPLGIGAETHSLEVQLSLGLTDELSIEHGTSISPATHLSPMEPSPLGGHFNHSMNQQHYYNPSSRGALDSFQLHEEFSSHEPVPITSDPSHQLVSVVSPEHHSQHQHQHHSQHHHHHHHSQHHQHSMVHHQHQLHSHQHQHVTAAAAAATVTAGQSHLHNHQQHHSQESGAASQAQQQHQRQHLSSVSDGNFSTLPSISDCYSQPPIIHHHGTQNHHQPHHQHLQQQQQQQQQQQHHHQYQALDQQWLSSSTSLAGDNNIHILESHNHNSMDHLIPISPGPNQNLDHVQFGSSIYHHNYYGHSTEHLDPFQQINADEFNTNSTTLANESNQMHRLQQDPQQQHSNLNNNNTSSNNYDHIHQSQNLQIPNPSATYSNEHSSSGHQQQTSHHSNSSNHHLSQMPHLVSGIEPGNVIIQDINLASATWTSPEDLYSI